MEATMVKQGLVFELYGTRLRIDAEVDADGGVERLIHSVRGGESREFSGSEISSGTSDEGTRATVMLESGAADGPIVRFTVILPPVIVGDEDSFEVTAAGLRSTQNSLFGGPRPGPQVSYEAIDLAGTVSCRRVDGEVGTCRDWYASHDHMPPGPARLQVRGSCRFPTTGYTVELRRHEPQGINPKDLLLDKVVQPPSGVIGPGSSDVEVRYEEQTDFEYDTVTILPSGPSIAVQEVQ
jgi:hypothetical protein